MSIISIPFLLCLGITLLIVGLVFMFFTQRLNEQNHKISSMVGLVSTMAEEVNGMKHHLLSNQAPNHFVQEKPVVFTENVQNDLISVSSDDDTDSESEYESEFSDDDDEEEPEEKNLEKEVIELSETKVINLGVLNCDILDDDLEDEESESHVEELDDGDLVEGDLDHDDDGEDSVVGDLDEKVVVLDNETENETPKEKFDFIKSIDISDLEETKESLDYKKLTTQKLKEIAVSRGIIAENAKANKNQLIKLLESSE
jgi:hypothetical protein